MLGIRSTLTVEDGEHIVRSYLAAKRAEKTKAAFDHGLGPVPDAS